MLLLLLFCVRGYYEGGIYEGLWVLRSCGGDDGGEVLRVVEIWKEIYERV